MSMTTVSTFPPLHAFDSPKSWFLAAIVLLHAGFFWALNNGFTLSVLRLPPPQTTLVPIPEVLKPPAHNRPIPVDRHSTQSIPVPLPQLPQPVFTEELPTEPPPILGEETGAVGGVALPEPTVVAPTIPRAGLSEPTYPSAAIRGNQTGTVLLSVYVLETGHVGEVRLARSSGHSILDQSALREAKRWRFVPGTRDGAPTPMWRSVPITFELATRM